MGLEGSDDMDSEDADRCGPRRQKAEGREVILQSGGYNEKLSVTPSAKWAPPKRGGRLGSSRTLRRRLGRALESTQPSGLGGGGWGEGWCLILI